MPEGEPCIEWGRAFAYVSMRRLSLFSHCRLPLARSKQPYIRKAVLGDKCFLSMDKIYIRFYNGIKTVNIIDFLLEEP